MVTKTEFEIHPGESLIFDNISALLDAPGAQGRSFNIKKGCKPRLISQSLERENTGPPYFSSWLLWKSDAGQDTVITIDVQSEGSYQTAIRPSETTNILQSATQISTARNERTEERKEFEIEVVKSIVYGGLAESITSLSVVSSAAGGGAATCKYSLSTLVQSLYAVHFLH